MSQKLELETLPQVLAISRLDPRESIPTWAMAGSYFSIARTSDELSIVCDESNVPEGVKVERGWRCFKVRGPLDFGLTGVLAALAVPLTDKQISIFAISTFETDYLLVKAKDFDLASRCLMQAGHKVEVGR